MKKKFFWILLLIPLLSGCNNINKPGEGKVKITSSGFENNLSPDYPKTGYYFSNKKINFRVEVVTDISIYVYLNDEKVIPKQYGDSVGEYDKYEIIVPKVDSTLVLTSDPFYLASEINLLDILPWPNNLTRGQLTGIKTIVTTEGVDPSKYPPTITTSSDPTDLNTFYNFLISEKVTKVDNYARILGGTSYEFIYIFNEAEYSFKIYGGAYHWMSFSQDYYFVLTTTPNNYPTILNI